MQQNAPRKKHSWRSQLILADGSLYPHKGTFSFADREVDVKTGTLRLAGAVSESGKYPSSRPVRPRSGDHNDERKALCSFPSARSQSCKVIIRWP